MQTLKLLSALLFLCLIPYSANAQRYSRVVFPKDSSVLDAKRDLGAKGDGVTDDTAALQKGFDLSCGIDSKTTKILYLPNGTYRVSGTLVVKSAIGAWVFGESRDGVILRLVDGAKECNAVIRTHPREKGPTSADWFMRNFRNFTVDVGNNPETDGIRWCSTNTGILQNIRVMGNGKIGINAGFIDQSSPNLIQDVVVEGFETGILTQWNWGQTLSRITIRNCRKQGIYVSATAVAIENLVVENTPLPLFCDYPNDWTWWGGVVGLVNARLQTSRGEPFAIRNRSVLYARNVKTDGYKIALQGETPAGSITVPTVTEYTSHPIKHLFETQNAALQLPIKPEPSLIWETNPQHWVCANDFGAVAGDNRDDTEAIQKAIDSAATAQKTTVYLRGIGGGDPNWYNVEGEIRVHGSVRHILGLGFGRVLAGKQGRFVVTDASAPVVKFQFLDAFGGSPIPLENRSKSRTLVAESCGVRILGTGTGDIFLTDCPATVQVENIGSHVWARHLNPEGESDTGLVENKGGTLWILGMKCEGKGVRAATRQGGRTEIFGMFNYGSSYDPKDRRPLFDVVNSQFSLMGVRELNFGNPAPVKIRETQGNETRTITNEQEGGAIGWALYNRSLLVQPKGNPTLLKSELPNLKGKRVSLLKEQGRKATALLFVTPDCPISNAYAPEYNAICEAYSKQKIAFAVIYVATDLTIKALTKHAKDFGYTCPTYVDRKNSFAHRIQAKMTPEVIVVLPNGATAYQGRIDDLFFDYGKRRPKPTQYDLRNALDAVLKGQPPTITRTTPIGCYIPDA
jgi:hypothetical protein